METMMDIVRRYLMRGKRNDARKYWTGDFAPVDVEQGLHRVHGEKHPDRPLVSLGEGFFVAGRADQANRVR